MIIINGVIWEVQFVSPYHSKLIRRDGSRSVGVCDKKTKTIYIRQGMTQDFTERVLSHEIFHAIIFSYNIKMDLDTEEHLANQIEKIGKP